MGSAGTVFNLNIGGNVIVGEDENTPGGSLHLGNVTSYEDTKWGGPMDVVTVGGDIILYNTSKLFMNVYNREGTSTYYDPDAYISGSFSFVGSGYPTYQNPTVVLYNLDPAQAPHDTKSIISVESLKGAATLMASAYSYSGSYRTDAVLFLRSENNETYTFEGWTYDISTGFGGHFKVENCKRRYWNASVLGLKTDVFGRS